MTGRYRRVTGEFFVRPSARGMQVVAEVSRKVCPLCRAMGVGRPPPCSCGLPPLVVTPVLPVIPVGGPAGCECGRCEYVENGSILRCAGALMASANLELAADGEPRR